MREVIVVELRIASYRCGVGCEGASQGDLGDFTARHEAAVSVALQILTCPPTVIIHQKTRE